MGGTALFAKVGLTGYRSVVATAESPKESRSCIHNMPLNPKHRVSLRHFVQGVIGEAVSPSLRTPGISLAELQSDLAARWELLSQGQKAKPAAHKRKHMEFSGSDQPIYSPQRAEGDEETGTEVSDVPRLRLKCTPKEARVYQQIPHLQGESALWAS